MRAVVVTEPGRDPEIGEFAEPVAGPGESVVELVGAGIHQIVRGLASGRHYGSHGEYPLVPGVDAVGRRTDGSLVYTGMVRAPWGTMAERFATRFGIELPDGVDPLAVAAGMNPGLSGWLPLSIRAGEVDSLGTVLILGATGMSGTLAAQSARVLGATRVVAAGRNEQSLARLAELGAEIVRLGGEDDAAALADVLSGDAPSIVLDYVWGPVAEAAFTALGRHGLTEDDADISYTQIGALAGMDAAVPASLLRSRRIRIVGSGAGSMSMQRLMAEAPRFMAAVASGRIEVPYTAFPLDQVEAAWHHTGSRAVLVP